ncbi:MAG TPA: hypothetical protein VHC43_18250 [Mycobacteriales bacterium]|nr:hypothetical protein [Mycobacteriales bacterium]
MRTIFLIDRPLAPSGEAGRAHGRTAAGLLFAVAMVAALVTGDTLYSGTTGWARLAANVGTVLLRVAFYLRFVHRQ